MIPILDLTQQYRSMKAEIDAAIRGVLESGVFIMGPNVAAFEDEIAAYLGVTHALALNSGTDALHLALRALNVGPGDEVITTPFTFVATTEAIGIVGATPVFVDIDPLTYNMDAESVDSAITSRTKAILPIHLYGSPCDLLRLQAIASRHGIPIVEDCAQAIGAEVSGKKVGSSSAFGCFSFFPSKNLGAYGDGGLITTNDSDLADRIRALRAHGGKKKYYHDELGINSRLDEIQAAILRVKLRHLDAWIQARRRIAHRYDEGLASHPQIKTPVERSGHRDVYHQYTVRVAERDVVRERLRESGVQTMVYYPVPLHLQNVHRGLASGGMRFPHSEQASLEVLSLPIFPELAEADQDRVLEALVAAAGVEANA
ncbi:MAG TPA: DegT/DnrJ/EryC1/StrS family aminotransferase [Candidatus Acidoferrales bacterium]|nr:DegT/DnrJ/EryC1/StrS family aminotransferase [Candidatus Acidoferrales bacterium]